MLKIDDLMLKAILSFRNLRADNIEVLSTRKEYASEIRECSEVFYDGHLMARCFLREKKVRIYVRRWCESLYVSRINAILQLTEGAFSFSARPNGPDYIYTLKQNLASPWVVDVVPVVQRVR